MTPCALQLRSRETTVLPHLLSIKLSRVNTDKRLYYDVMLYGSSITYARTVSYLNKKDIVRLRTPLPSVLIKIVCGTVSSSVSSASNQCGYCTAHDGTQLPSEYNRI